MDIQVLLKELDDKPGKFNMRWEGPYTVIGKTSGVNYKLRKRDGTNYVTHVDRMKRFHTKDTVPLFIKERQAQTNRQRLMIQTNRRLLLKRQLTVYNPSLRRTMKRKNDNYVGKSLCLEDLKTS
jgi:hypothetical protein